MWISKLWIRRESSQVIKSSHEETLTGRNLFMPNMWLQDDSKWLFPESYEDAWWSKELSMYFPILWVRWTYKNSVEISYGHSRQREELSLWLSFVSLCRALKTLTKIPPKTCSPWSGLITLAIQLDQKCELVTDLTTLWYRFGYVSCNQAYVNCFFFQSVFVSLSSEISL